MDNSTMAVRLEHWTQLVQNCVNSGLSKKEWCEKNQIPPKTFFTTGRGVSARMPWQYSRHFLTAPLSQK